MDGAEKWRAAEQPPLRGHLRPLVLPDDGDRRALIADGPNHPRADAYDLLRTRIATAAGQRGWARIGIAQTRAADAGPRTALNLALAEARRADRRVVLVDLDIARQPVLALMGGHAGRDAPGALEGWAIAPNLALLTVPAPAAEAATTLMREGFRTGLSAAIDDLAPDIVILHLPPLLWGDAGLAGMDLAQAVVLAVDGRADTAADIRRCEARITDICPLLGVFLHDGEA